MYRKLATVLCALLLTSCASIGIPQPTPTVAPTLTPSATLATTAIALVPSRTPRPTLTNTARPSATASPQSSTTPSPEPSVTTAPSVTPSRTATSTPTLSPTPTASPTNTVPPTNTPLPTLGPTHTSSVTPTFTSSPSLSPTPTDTHTPLPTETPSHTATFTPSATLTPQPTATITATSSLTQTPSVTASRTATLTRVPPSRTPDQVPSSTATVDPFFMTPAPTWTPRDTDTPTPTVVFTAPPQTAESPPAVTLGPSDTAPESPLPTLTPAAGDTGDAGATSTPTLTPPPRVPPVTPPPTLSVALIQVLLPLPEAVGGLPFQVDPGALNAASQVAASPSAYQPFRVPNPAHPGEAIVTDEFGVMYWEVNGERHGMPAPFTSFGPGSLENSDKLVTAASWSPDGLRIAFIVDNPQRGDANDGVWWWDTRSGEAYQVMHNCRRNVHNCPDFVNAESDPYVNPPVGEPEQFNTGWYAVSVSWSPDGTRLLARLRIREDQRLAFIVLPLAADGAFKRLRRDVCKYEFSDWATNSRAVIVGGRDANGSQVLGVIDVPENVPLDGAVACGDIRPLDTTGANTVRVTPAAAFSGALPSGVVEGSEFEPGQELVVASPNSEGLNLRTEPNADVPNVIRYLLNGEFVRVLAGPYDQGALRWWRVRTAQGEEGWIVSAIGVTQVLQNAP